MRLKLIRAFLFSVLLALVAACSKKNVQKKPAPVATASDNSKIESDLKEAKKKIEELLKADARRKAELEALKKALEKGQKEGTELIKSQVAKLQKQIDELKAGQTQSQAEIEKLRRQIEGLQGNSAKIAELEKQLKEAKKELAAIKVELSKLGALKAELEGLRRQVEKNQLTVEELSKMIAEIDRKLEQNKRVGALYHRNRMKFVENLMQGHTGLYPLEGGYKVMVIPVQFSDITFQPESLTHMKSGKMQEALFDPKKKNSMRTYFRHASFGKFDVDGKVLAPVTVSGERKKYGEAMSRTSDRDARGLVKEALMQVRAAQPDPRWWDEYDQWDLNDYDGDGNYREPDGFIDAVVLIYAGKSQSSCQASFDVDGTRPASSEVKPGPRHDAAVECFNRLWPHRWSLAIAADDPEYSKKGPIVEGRERPSMSGLKINDQLFATDYNMQSEYSDLSTFMHEFGHSITLPDIYASSGANSAGSWELMASNAGNQAQELSSYSKLALGWLKPKIINQGEKASAYLGAYNFVTEEERNRPAAYKGPRIESEKGRDGETQEVSVVSRTPASGESVYRSVVVTTKPTWDQIQVVKPLPEMGKMAVYSGRFDGEYRRFKQKLMVPKTGDAKVKFDLIYHIETETDFDSKKEKMNPKEWTYYDRGFIRVNGEDVEKLSWVSGDANSDTLNENHPSCKVDRVLALRTKRIKSGLSDAEKAELKQERAVCWTATWQKKEIDLSKFRGQEVEFEIGYLTDGGYTEFGIVFDNLEIGGQKIDFENYGSGDSLGSFVGLKDGAYHKHYSQFYLMEYRDPSVVYDQNVSEVSYNMDRNINQGSQSMFVENDEASPLKGFRSVEFDYQKGVLVWYYNSRFEPGPGGNSPMRNKGKGYLLVLNPKVQEVPIPGVFSDPSLFDEKGYYKAARNKKGEYVDPHLKHMVEAQRETLGCFAYTRYFKYVKGREPNCEGISKWSNYMTQLISANGKKLIYRREGFNDVLPKDRYGNVGIGVPFRTNPYMRTGLSPFRPAGKEHSAKPFTVYKESGGKMVIDEEITSSQKVYPSVSAFSDETQSSPEHGAYLSDTVQVEKVGFSFEVTEPSDRIQSDYSRRVGANENNYFHRRPKVKIWIDWK